MNYKDLTINSPKFNDHETGFMAKHDIQSQDGNQDLRTTSAIGQNIFTTSAYNASQHRSQLGKGAFKKSTDNGLNEEDQNLLNLLQNKLKFLSKQKHRAS